MPGVELRRVFHVGASPERVFAHLAEPANYVGLSPLVVAVRDVRREGGTVHCTAVERFRVLGPLRYDNAIRVTLEADGTGLPDAAGIGGEVRSPGGVRLSYRYTVVRDGDGSAVTDVLRLRAPVGLLRFAASRARAVQAARARILARRLG
ncbi:SRPBCC family protein [Streptacidiphilus sp. ASG 303]|uniref:SRPBCC family protein n=1 Tax=Streptacidiphilus sp. ASG 303 TaxID=2896847 RepID=UPI001E2E9189|nr:SRPBCC family protein [Streptacidiphilus sp. ASG 303]MCD0481001.1 SRPBCC family protein [Streptacidiphilus sp. ASG 303]